jgi:hypothetical protein
LLVVVGGDMLLKWFLKLFAKIVYDCVGERNFILGWHDQTVHAILHDFV